MESGSDGLQISCREFIRRNCKASVLRVFPGEFLEMPVQNVIDAAAAGNRRAQTGRKLLFRREYRK